MVLSGNCRIEGFSSRLLAVIGEESVRSFARKSGFSEGVIRNYIHGDTYPTLDRLAVLATVGGCSVEWLAVGNQQPVNDAVLTALPYQPDDEEGISSCLIGLNLDWVGVLAENQDFLVSQVITDDAMSPLLKKGDLVVVDISRKQWDDSGIYLFELEGRWVSRRIELLLNGTIRVSGDNDAYSEQILSVSDYKELKILGRVVWAGGPI